MVIAVETVLDIVVAVKLTVVALVVLGKESVMGILVLEEDLVLVIEVVLKIAQILLIILILVYENLCLMYLEKESLMAIAVQVTDFIVIQLGIPEVMLFIVKGLLGESHIEVKLQVEVLMVDIATVLQEVILDIQGVSGLGKEIIILALCEEGKGNTSSMGALIVLIEVTTVAEMKGYIRLLLLEAEDLTVVVHLHFKMHTSHLFEPKEVMFVPFKADVLTVHHDLISKTTTVRHELISKTTTVEGERVTDFLGTLDAEDEIEVVETQQEESVLIGKKVHVDEETAVGFHMAKIRIVAGVKQGRNCRVDLRMGLFQD